MTIGGQAVFYLCGLLALLSAVGTILVHSPIRAAMCLLAHIVALTALFLTLHAHLLAAIQLIVYAGAVVVLFVFVIMLIGPATTERAQAKGILVKTASAAIMGVVTALFAFSLVPVDLPYVSIMPCEPGEGAECSQFGGVAAFAHSLFLDALVPFELISVLLTIAVIGAIAVARGRTVEEAHAARQRRETEDKAQQDREAKERAMAAEVAAHGGHG